MQIAVVGIGYVGLSMAMLLSQNHKVVALDIVPEKINLLKYNFIILTLYLVQVVSLSQIILIFFFPFHLNYYIHLV